jgi:colanic acid/amylovoran biosynthesis glycosyltransferase
MTAIKLNYPLAVISPNIGRYSETFIRRFMQDLLPGQTVAIAKNLSTEDPNWKQTGPALILIQLPQAGLKRQVVEAVLWQLGWKSRDRAKTEIDRFLTRYGVKVILSNYLDESLPYLETAKALGIRFYAHAHGYDISERLRDSRWRKEYLAYNEADGIIVVSESVRARLAGIGLKREKIHVIPCMPDIPEDMRERRGGETIRCVMLGRLVPKKAPILALDAFRRAFEVCPRLRLEVVGGGPLLAAMREYVQAFGMAGVVTLHGAQPAGGEVIRALWSRADIFMQHSMVDPESGDEEGLPVSILEAMGQGLPVVSTRHAGIPEAVVEGETGFLVSEGDSVAMSECLIRLAQDRKLGLSMGEAGWKRAKENFAWSIERSRLLAVIGLQESTGGMRLPE